MNTVSTGINGLDQVIDKLRLGDNVVWQVDSLDDYRKIVNPYIEQAVKDNRRIIYIRFGTHEPIILENSNVILINVEAEKGFEYFASTIHSIIEGEGKRAFYVFDCLTDLLKYWYSDLMIGNFFKVTCPFLYELETIAYFALIRDSHTNDTISRIRETTQVLLDLYNIDGTYYVHPLKVYERYSSNMFLPHLITRKEALCISASFDASLIFSRFNLNSNKLDYWDVTFNDAYTKLSGSNEAQEKAKELLIKLLIGRESKMYDLCKKYFTLRDLLNIKGREIGTGMIGGKSVGMLLARKILESDKNKRFKSIMEIHDSFYLGTDVFYTYIVQNGCWSLRTKQKTEEGYYKYAPKLKEKLLNGTFSNEMKTQFMNVLEYFGQSPIIVRSSSLLEDNFGNAFAGKYDSVFCTNQGTSEERYNAFEEAVKIVYASTMNEDALNYRKNRGLVDKDEQMALLIQRVSGDKYGNYFFPHLAGVGNSSNLYVWDKNIDMNAGMLRLVVGLGTRAVDRIEGDYPRIVCLDDPKRVPLISYGDEKKFSQHYMDCINIEKNSFCKLTIDDGMSEDLRTSKDLFAQMDYETSKRKRELNLKGDAYIINFKNLFNETNFAEKMKEILELLCDTYDYPVDIEFTANFKNDKIYKINILQCRPLQTRGLGKLVDIPKESEEIKCLFKTHGNFMGGNVHYKVDYIVHIKAKEYLNLNEQERFKIARKVGELNSVLKDRNAILIGPGRWGTTITSLGVPVHFTELCNMLGIFEVAYKSENLMPELSYGSHFFQDLVESGIFYGAIFNGDDNVKFNEDLILESENIIGELIECDYDNVIHVIKAENIELFSDTVSQTMICLKIK